MVKNIVIVIGVYFLLKILLKVLKIGTRFLQMLIPLGGVVLIYFYGEEAFQYWKSHPSLIVLTVCLLGLTLLVRIILPKRRVKLSGIGDIDQMSGEEFEIYLELLFTEKGYQVKRTAYVGDYGVDLVVRNHFTTYAVQAKRYQGKVGVKAVQEVVAGMGYYDCQEGMVVTNSYFTPQAIELARKNGVILWDRNQLIRQIRSVQTKKGRSTMRAKTLKG